MSSRPVPIRFLLLFALLGFALACCAGPQATVDSITVQIVVDGMTLDTAIPIGSTVQYALDEAGVVLGTLDQVSPAVYTSLTESTSIQVTRLNERFEIEQIEIPFERQTIRNEALPRGESRLLQPGSNGLQEITYRILEEEGVELSRTPVKNVILRDPTPEIVMVGLQAAYTPLAIEGRLAYVSGRNAWLIQGDTGNRRPIVLSGDLDGRIFKLSPDGRWLLYTRQMEEADEIINSLWVISTTDPDSEPIDLDVYNIIHFADWVPGIESLQVTYSTVEASPAAPGWQANNDLLSVRFTASGIVFSPETILEANAGGQYGWWGTHFAWGEDRRHLAYARADSVGFIDIDQGRFEPSHEFAPYQTFSDWAWVPGVAWGRDNRTLFYVDHGAPLGIESPGASPVFDLIALTGPGGLKLAMATKTGMFAYPSVSPALIQPSGEISYKVAFLQAISPLDSETSSYRLVIMDRDGSNLATLFPEPGEPGLEPQQVAWSPNADRIAVSYRGDLWVIDVDSGVGQRLTGEGQTLNYDWKP